ncbi:hypothetical protein H5410_011483 [Solanum commersonii]|uniref:Uncharacterized protein n=1 Tax=Solanum commersonii TaxID=4109 RepID=A0A9J6APK8_SOLCO|nr:hypothetical protein H5410_011483 [Solanum commersonii]
MILHVPGRSGNNIAPISIADSREYLELFLSLCGITWVALQIFQLKFSRECWELFQNLCGITWVMPQNVKGIMEGWQQQKNYVPLSRMNLALSYCINMVTAALSNKEVKVRKHLYIRVVFFQVEGSRNRHIDKGSCHK